MIYTTSSRVHSYFFVRVKRQKIASEIMPSPRSLLAARLVMALCMGIQTALVLQMPHSRSCLVIYQVMALCMGIQSIQQTMASKLSNPIRIVSYNVRGFRSGQSFVSDLLHQCDLLCLQEHWLLDQHLSTMNICEEFRDRCEWHGT